MKLQTKDLTKIAIMAALIAIGAFIKIPVPVVGYFTLQLTFVILAGIILGPRKGAMAVIVYVVGGLIGIPWFTSGGGLGYVVQPTFGFLLSFIPGAYIAGLASNKKNKSLEYTILLAIVSTIFVWVFGMLYLSGIYQYYMGNDYGFIVALTAIVTTSLPSFLMDIFLAVVASFVGLRVRKGIKGL